MAFSAKQNDQLPPSQIMGNRGLHSIASSISQFGTNCGTLHTQLIQEINEPLQDNINKKEIEEENEEENEEKDCKEEPEALRCDVINLKRKLFEIINNAHNKKKKDIILYEELYILYTCHYLQHPLELNTSAAKDQLKQEYTDNDILITPNKPLLEIIILGQTLYLLSIYELEINNIAISHKYIIRALMYWRCANQYAKRMGVTTKPSYSINKSLFNDIFCVKGGYYKKERFPVKTNLDIDDLGFFWPQLVQCYIMAGNIFLKHFEYDVSDLMYRTSLELCHCMEGRYHFSCIDPLEHLMTQMIIKHDIISAIIYCEEILKIMTMTMNTNNITKNEYKFINTKALYSCLLRLSNNKNYINLGIKLKDQCIKECINKFGIASGHTFQIYLYFIKHCIHSNSKNINHENIGFNEADKMINYLSSTFCIIRKLKYFEEYYLCKLYQEYILIIYQQSNMINNHQNYQNHQNHQNHHHIKRLEMLYPLHMKHINNLNSNPLSKQYNKNMKINKIKIQQIYVNIFEKYKDIIGANKLRQQIMEINHK